MNSLLAVGATTCLEMHSYRQSAFFNQAFCQQQSHKIVLRWRAVYFKSSFAKHVQNIHSSLEWKHSSNFYMC